LLILEGIHSEHSNRVSKLKHSWIKHLILERDAANVAYLRNAPERERIAFENRIKPSGDFDIYVAEARTLLRTMEEGFSAVHLAETELQQLPKEIKELIFTIVQNLYLAQTGIDKLTVPMREAINDLEIAIGGLREEWFRDGDQNALRESFKEVQLKAKKLDEILNLLPKGIVLP
jgi:hypothetical protein